MVNGIVIADGTNILALALNLPGDGSQTIDHKPYLTPLKEVVQVYGGQVQAWCCVKA
jgi:hypothetical protein